MIREFDLPKTEPLEHSLFRLPEETFNLIEGSIQKINNICNGKLFKPVKEDLDYNSLVPVFRNIIETIRSDQQFPPAFLEKVRQTIINDGYLLNGNLPLIRDSIETAIGEKAKDALIDTFGMGSVPSELTRCISSMRWRAGNFFCADLLWGRTDLKDNPCANLLKLYSKGMVRIDYASIFEQGEEKDLLVGYFLKSENNNGFSIDSINFEKGTSSQKLDISNQSLSTLKTPELPLPNL